MIYDAIVLAFGKGLRSGLGYNKVLYRLSDGMTILDKAIKPFIEDADCHRVIVVLEMDSRSLIYQDKKIVFCNGGKERFDSVLKALELVDSPFVFIHDGARPDIVAKDLNNLKEGLKEDEACILANRAKDTIKVVKDGYIEKTLDRNTIYLAKTPQAFKSAEIKEAYLKAAKDDHHYTDDCEVFQKYIEKKIRVIDSTNINDKVTFKEDLAKII